MKNTTITTTAKRAAVKVKAQQPGHHAMFNDLDAVEHRLNKLWDMFKVQLERNYELMNIVNKQTEQIINQSGIQHILPVAETPAPLPAEIKQEIKAEEKPFVALTYDKLQTLVERFQNVFPFKVKRIDAIQAHVSFLYTLYQIGERATHHQLFMSAGVTNVTGYRYLSAMREMKMIELRRIGTENLFALSDVGRKFIDGEIVNQEQYYVAIGKGEIRYS
jgi:hypothetical protein